MIDLAAAPDPSKLDTDDLLAFLRELAADLDVTLERQSALYDLRTRAFIAARNRNPRVTLGQLAEASGASEAAVTQVLHKVRRTATG
jgi:hypothetical protein